MIDAYITKNNKDMKTIYDKYIKLVLTHRDDSKTILENITKIVSPFSRPPKGTF